MKDDLLKKELSSLALNLRERPAVLYSGATDYYSTKIFLEGYFYGKFGDYQLFNEIRSWLSRREGVSLDIAWTDYPKYYLADKPDEEKRERVISILEDFLLEY